MKRKVSFILARSRKNALYATAMILLLANLYLLLRFIITQDELLLTDHTNEDSKAFSLRSVEMKQKVENPLIRLLQNMNITYSKVCFQPKLSLQHDTLAFAFYDMEPLKCSGAKLFYLQQGFLVSNKTAFLGRKLKTCQVIAVERVSDVISDEVKLFDVTSEVNLTVNTDFIYIKCDFVTDQWNDSENTINFKEDSEMENKQQDSLYVSKHFGLRFTNRHLLSFSRQHVFKNKKITEETNSSDDFNKTLSQKNSANFSVNGSYYKNVSDESMHVKLVLKDSVQDIKNFIGLTKKTNYKAADVKENLALSKDSQTTTLKELPEEYLLNKEMYLYENWRNGFVDESLNCDEQFLVQVNPYHHVFERARQAPRIKGATGLNVLMFGIDSMSSLTFKRKLPQTLDYLKTVLGAVVYEGYNIVGDGTTQAILPILLGQLQHEIPDILEHTLDDLDFVWKLYESRGYATMFAEDEPHLGVFNLRLKGFEEKPTDHYMRYFWQSQKESQLSSLCSEKYCTGPVPNHMYLINYLQDFFHKYRNISRFAVGFSGELSHDDINPSQYLDPDLKEFLRHLRTKGYLRDTMVILFSDHGSRRGKVRRTLQGKMEERLPFFAVYFPPAFRKKYPHLYNNVIMNANYLTSPFDVHKTLLDVLDLSQRNSTGRGISLLRKIPENRSCSDAGIDTHWCTCVQEVPVPLNDPLVQGASKAVVDSINSLTNSISCVQLALNSTHSASLVVPNINLLKFDKSNDEYAALYGDMTLDSAELQVTVEMDKCQGVFEATVQVRYGAAQPQEEGSDVGAKQLTFHVDEKDISRINTYGLQSACICQSKPQLMKFCCCVDFLAGKKLKPC